MSSILTGMHIFVIDDDIRNRLIYKLLLPKHGAVVEQEGWGPDVMHHMERLAKVDLILLDLMLQHGISGFDLFGQIRARSQYDGVPIIAVSAADPGTAMPRAQQLGFNGYIAKPIDQETFPHQLSQVLQGKPIWYAGKRYAGIESQL
jgi:CheY-like chemotaxis protein